MTTNLTKPKLIKTIETLAARNKELEIAIDAVTQATRVAEIEGENRSLRTDRGKLRAHLRRSERRQGAT